MILHSWARQRPTRVFRREVDLIRILTMVYYNPYITGSFFIPYIPSKTSIFFTAQFGEPTGQTDGCCKIQSVAETQAKPRPDVGPRKSRHDLPAG